MDGNDIPGELGMLVEELDDRVDWLLREHGALLAAQLDRQLRPIESLADELYFGQRVDDRVMRETRRAIDGLRTICDRLPTTLVQAVDSSAFDRLRALRVDLELEPLTCIELGLVSRPSGP